LLRQKWDEIANEAQQYNLNLASSLKLSYPIEIKEKRLNIGVAGEIYSDWIKKNIKFIRQKVKEICGVELEIKTSICDIEKFKEDVVNINPELKLKKLMDESPIVKSLIENLGAKPID
jgi:hypothetical protein